MVYSKLYKINYISMKTNTRELIFEYIFSNNPVSITELKQEFNISTQMIHRHINNLFGEDKIYKIWTTPKVYYFPVKESNDKISIQWQEIDDDFFDINKFAFFWPDWENKFWKQWFIARCNKRNLDVNKEFKVYERTIKKYDNHKTKYWLIMSS